MNRLQLSLLGCLFVALTACESTPDPVYEPEPEPERQPYVEPKPEPKPEPVPARLDKSKPPADRPVQAFERKTINPKDCVRPTFAELLDGKVADWRKKLEPPFVEGTPHAMENVKTSGSWWNGKGNLRCESQTLANGGWKAHGYGEATYNSNGKLFAKGNFCEGQLHGPWIFYNEDESLESVRCYKMGTLAGPYAGYENGVVTKFGYSRDGVGQDEWWYWDGEGNLEYRIFWTVRNGKPEKVWEHHYNAEGKLLVEWTYVDGKSTDDVIAWRKSEYDEQGNLTNPGSADRLELESYKDGKLHGWTTMYNQKDGFREYDTWYEKGEQSGPFIRYNAKGEVIARGHKLNGNNYGKWTSTDAQGYTREYNYDADGQLHGRYVVKQDGKIIEDLTYDHGEIEDVGVVTRTANRIDREFGSEAGETWIGKGAADEHNRFDGQWSFSRADGSLAAEGSYQAGKRSGEWTFYYADGDTIRVMCKYDNDKLNGSHTKFYPDGTSQDTGAYWNGLPTGQWTHRFQNGQIESVGVYTTSSYAQKSGEWKYFREDGSLLRQGSYTSGFMSGLWNEYDKSGVICRVESRDLFGSLEGSIEREAGLEAMPEGITQDPEKMTGTWVWKDTAGKIGRRAVMINGEGAGLYQQYYANGKLGMEGELIGESREGTWKVWTETGVLKEQADYVGNKKTGTYMSWRSDGTKLNEGGYTDDVKTGSWKTFHADGVTTATEHTYGPTGEYEGIHRAWTAAGQLTIEGTYSVNKRHGGWKEWHPDGKPRMESNYINGELTGLHRLWFSNGQLKLEGTYAANKPSGEIKHWNEQGQLLKHEVYDEQRRKQGTWKTWHANGQQATEAIYEDDKPAGVWKSWDQQGTLITETNHDEPDDQPEEDSGE
jgi:antitoxin component YwqK of YwqJK toxin-antitoxin module